MNFERNEQTYALSSDISETQRARRPRSRAKNQWNIRNILRFFKYWLCNTYGPHQQFYKNVDSLSTKMLILYRPLPKETYRIHNPEGLRYLFQLRVGLSPLRYHKKQHHFLDTPSDTCLCNTGSETVEHFLFRCPFYASKRLVLAQTVVPILINHNLAFLQNDVNLYLYGHRKLKNDNKNILLATITFIKSTNRFD